MKILKCILIDDEIPGLRYLKLLVEQIPDLEIVKVYDNPAKFLAEYTDLSFDLCILDIEMPHINGLTLAQKMSDKLIIFTTAYSSYAADAFDINAVDYIRKPLTLERLITAVDKARNMQPVAATPHSVYTFNTDHGKYLLHLADILFIRNSDLDSRDKDVFLYNGEVVRLKNITFASLENKLPEQEFARINKKELIRIKIVQSYSNNVITSIPLPNGQIYSFTLSLAFRQQFTEKLPF